MPGASTRDHDGRGHRLLFTTYAPPLGVPSGALVRTQRLLAGLAGAFDVTLLCSAAEPDRAQVVDRSELAAAFPGVDVVTVPARRARPKRVEQLLSLRSRASWSYGRFRTRAFREALHATARRVVPAVVHYDHLAAALSGPVPGCFNAYASHNVEYRIAERAAQVSGGVRRRFAEVESPRIRREEVGVWRCMDVSLAVSDVDAAAMRAGGAPRVGICLGGTDPVPLQAAPRRMRDETLRLLFVGLGTYHPNEHGIAWFVQHVLPRIAAELPVALDVVGAPPHRPVMAPGVTYVGAVPSLEDHYARAHVAIIPLFYGSGSRGKVVEAMAYGRPVVSTPLGVEGLHVEPGRHYLAAQDADAFADALVRLGRRLEAPDGALDALLGDARRLAERHFWPAVVADLVAFYEEEIAGMGTGSPAR